MRYLIAISLALLTALVAVLVCEGDNGYLLRKKWVKATTPNTTVAPTTPVAPTVVRPIGDCTPR